jgi:hypothetical protein
MKTQPRKTQNKLFIDMKKIAVYTNIDSVYMSHLAKYIAQGAV